LRSNVDRQANCLDFNGQSASRNSDWLLLSRSKSTVYR
jgi:hypothetical protein